MYAELFNGVFKAPFLDITDGDEWKEGEEEKFADEIACAIWEDVVKRGYKWIEYYDDGAEKGNSTYFFKNGFIFFPCKKEGDE